MKPRVIIIEDNENLRYLLSTVLEEKGYEVLTFSEPLHCPVYFGSGCKCEDEQVCTDVLITDNKMPNMTGIEFLELQDKQGCKLDHRSKAIMSGNFSDEDIQKITKLGCKIFYKPFNLNEILEWIKECETRILPKRKLIVYNHVQV